MDLRTVEHSIVQIHAAPARLVFEFAGAGSLALCWLHAVPGSSRTILEATDRYAPAAMADLLGHVPETFVSRTTAETMAERAYQRAMALADGAQPCIGVACTATIATDRTKRGDHRCWVAVRDRESAAVYSLTLTKGLRDRLGEETLVSQLILRAIAVGCGIAAEPPLEIIGDERVVVVREQATDPIADLLDGSVRSVLVAPDGALTPDAPVTGALLSGSFNPLHIGHERLAEAAARAVGRLVMFELPILNPDKPPLGYAEIARRTRQFRWRYPVVLSCAPLFVEKAALFPGCMFVVGYDTAVRLAAPRYYGGAAARDAALAAIRAAGCRFLVAGRMTDGAFHTLADLAIPAPFRDMFIALPEHDFRVDLSSTAIRAQQESANKTPNSATPPS